MRAIPVRQIHSKINKIDAGRFSIRDLQEVLDGKNLVHDLHRHDFYFVLALLKGTGVHEVDFVEYPVGDGSVFIIRPGQVHRLELAGDCQGFLLEFDLSFYHPKKTITDRRWKKATTKNYCRPMASRFKRLHSIISSVYEEFTRREEGWPEAIRANLDLFFIEHIRQSMDPGTASSQGDNYSLERFEELTRLLEQHISTVKTVPGYCKLLNLSPYQLNAITKSLVGKTVSEMINEQVVLEAKRRLLATTNQVKDIADQLGFEDPSYFIRFFKKRTGESPEAFRRNFK